MSSSHTWIIVIKPRTLFLFGTVPLLNVVYKPSACKLIVIDRAPRPKRFLWALPLLRIMIERYTIDRVVSFTCSGLPLQETLDIHLSSIAISFMVSGKEVAPTVVFQILNATVLTCILFHVVTVRHAFYSMSSTCAIILW